MKKIKFKSSEEQIVDLLGQPNRIEYVYERNYTCNAECELAYGAYPCDNCQFRENIRDEDSKCSLKSSKLRAIWDIENDDVYLLIE